MVPAAEYTVYNNNGVVDHSIVDSNTRHESFFIGCRQGMTDSYDSLN